mmetsp:Transcript_29909/g.88909  ORF Transcript_29909/g.88909 Transcript_29909/m.88909 type:complete len:151 (-) Transcript_29909:1370-1822(-)
MESKSITSTLGMPERARSFSNSHPRPPAPTTRTLALVRGEDGGSGPDFKAIALSSGSNSPMGSAPVSFANGDGRLRRVRRDPLLSPRKEDEQPCDYNVQPAGHSGKGTIKLVEREIMRREGNGNNKPYNSKDQTHARHQKIFRPGCPTET